MTFLLKLGTIGKAPEVDWKGKNAELYVEFPVAENHNINVGTKEEPEWETVDTSWYIMTAWGDTAKAILDANLDQGDAIKIKGIHKIRKYQKENEKPRYFNVYRINEFSKYERNSDK